MPVHCGKGGAGSHPTPGHMIWKWTVNTTFAMGHQVDPVHCKKLSYISTFLQFAKYTMYIIIFDWGKR
jgi:hypothetical protein